MEILYSSGKKTQINLHMYNKQLNAVPNKSTVTAAILSRVKKQHNARASVFLTLFGYDFFVHIHI